MIVVSADAVEKAQRSSWPVRVSADVPEILERLAERHFTSPSLFLEDLIARAEGPIVRGVPEAWLERFIARVQILAAQRVHPRAARTTSYYLGAPYVEGIRQLQNSLQLPRNGLVVEYLVRAAWDVEGDDDGGDDGDELKRRRRSGSQNLHYGN